MILIYEERRKRFIDLNIVQRQISDAIKEYRKDIDDEKDPSDLMINLDESLDLISIYESELQDIKAMQKVPFDVLIVIQKEDESLIDCSDIDMTKRAMREC